MTEKQSLQEWLGRDRGQIALAFTDIIGSTRTALFVGDKEWIEALKIHFDKARNLMLRYEGHEVKLIGDSCMVVFHSAALALQFALDMRGDGPFDMPNRAAVHVGEVQVVENDIYGTMINYTSRVLKAAAIAPSNVVISNAAYQQIMASMGKMRMATKLQVSKLTHECLNEFPSDQRDLYQVSRKISKK